MGFFKAKLTQRNALNNAIMNRLGAECLSHLLFVFVKRPKQNPADLGETGLQ